MLLMKSLCLFLPPETEEVKKEETAAVVKPEGKRPEFVLKIKTQTVSCSLSIMSIIYVN